MLGWKHRAGWRGLRAPVPTVSQPVIQEVDPRELGIPDTPYSASYTATSQGWGQYDATRYPSAQYSSLNQEQSLESTEQAALAPDALAPCEALRNVVTVRECERFTAIKRMAEDGNATLAAPESMDAGQSYDVFVIVGTKEQRASIEETAASVGTFFPARSSSHRMFALSFLRKASPPIQRLAMDRNARSAAQRLR